MKKLTRYSDFNTLKLDVKPTNANLKRNNKYLRELEDFLTLLRSKLQESKANNKAHDK